MSVVAHVFDCILKSRDLIIRKMILGGMAILRIMMAILRLDTPFLMVIPSVCDNFYDLLFVTCLKAVTMCEFLNHISV
jgi:hypothetical protein